MCFLLGAGPLYGWAADKRPGDFLIAADGGYAYAAAAGWTPDLLLGDFDSLGRVPDAAGTLVLPREKDDTDMLAAAREGLKRGFSTFYILGGTGGRIGPHACQYPAIGLSGRRGRGGLPVCGAQCAAPAARGRGALPRGANRRM